MEVAERAPSLSYTGFMVSLYIVSGVTQPLIMTLAKDAGIADSNAQLYMLFYYLGPASVALFVTKWPPIDAFAKTGLVSIFDCVAQAFNYTGSALAGPTLFAIIYSSVTVWTAIFSRIFLKRKMSLLQWMSVCIVFLGLIITGFSTVSLGPEVIHGSCLVLLGSAMHALTYVMSEAVMVKLAVGVNANCAIQGLVATVIYVLWQLLYTRPHFQEAILDPMQSAGTTVALAATILGAFFLANLFHSTSYFHTLRYVPGGATSAGIMKGLQAVLVFVVTSLFYCGRRGGDEMCFSAAKFASLVVVVGGVVLFGKATSDVRRREQLGYEAIHAIGDTIDV